MADKLQRECLKNGNGLDIKHIENIRKILTDKFEERTLASGYSYFDINKVKARRFLKLAVVKDRFFVEFNTLKTNLKDISDILLLDKNDRRDLHAGGVEFCYYGDNFQQAEKLIAEAKTNY